MKKLFLFILVAMLLTTSLAIAQEEAEEELEIEEELEEELTNPGLTPDNALYGLDRAFERISLAFTFNNAKRARRRLQIAEERLAELRAMEQKGKPEFIADLVEDIEEETEEAENEVEEEEALGKDVNALREHVATMTHKHVYVLERVWAKVSEQAKPAIERVIAKSKERQERILARFRVENEATAARLRFKFAEGALVRLRERIRECGDSCEESCGADDSECNNECKKQCVNGNRVKEKIKETVEEYKKHLEESDEIIESTEEDITELEQKMANSAAKHLAVLARVYEEAPEEAKSGIENAMSVSVMNRERVVNALKNKGIVNNFTANLVIADKIREKMPVSIKEKVSGSEETGSASASKGK